MRAIYLSLLFIISLSACTSQNTESVRVVQRPLATPTYKQPSLIATPHSPTATPSATHTITPSPTMIATQTPLPTRTPLPASPPITRTTGIPPAGLIFHTADGLWRINESGNPEQISDQENAILSPTNQQLLYVQDDDIWLTNLTTGETENLTQTPNRYECCPLWWPEQENLIVFGSWPDTYDRYHTDFGDFQFGFLTIWNDGSYQVLDDTEPFYNSLAPRPASDTVIYGNYLFDQQPHGTLQEQEYTGIPVGTTIQSISHATWSPDGNLLAAYIVYRHQNGEQQYHLALIDIDQKQIQHLADFYVRWPHGARDAPTWSPDGSMIAYHGGLTSNISPADEFGLWLIKPNSNEILFNPSSERIDCDRYHWHPTSTKLVCEILSGQDDTFLMLDLANNTLTQFELPTGAFVTEWR